MTNHGIITIEWSSAAEEKLRKDIINVFYSGNYAAITGMAYYETTDEKLIDKIQKLCESKEAEPKSMTKVRLIYKNEISGELYVEDVIEHMDEYWTHRLADRIVICQDSQENQIFYTDDEGVKSVPRYKWIKEDSRYSVHRLVGLELIE